MHKYQFHKLPRTPFDPDGERWCRACQDLTVSAFPAGERQYVCQQHLWQCCMKPRTERVLGHRNRMHAGRLHRIVARSHTKGRCWATKP